VSLYSVEFYKTAGAGHSAAYVVPAGKRAVVRSIVAASGGEANTFAWIYLAGVLIYAVHIPATDTLHQAEMRQVAYAGEQLAFVTYGSAVHLGVGGYLFNDSGLDRAPETVELPHGALLPAHFEP
jgi:hypothetical protein